MKEWLIKLWSGVAAFILTSLIIIAAMAYAAKQLEVPALPEAGDCDCSADFKAVQEKTQAALINKVCQEAKTCACW
jgi:hypothetical protein